jgi:hypothetical protein
VLDSGSATMVDDDVDQGQAAGVFDSRLPCPSPVCVNLPAADDRFCEVCGTWLGLEGEKPPTGGPLRKALRNSGALKLAGIVERVEGKLNDWCD